MNLVVSGCPGAPLLPSSIKRKELEGKRQLLAASTSSVAEVASNNDDWRI